MVDYKRILRLRAEGVSQRGIADVMGCSRNTVSAVFTAADTAGIGFEQVADLGADEVRHLLLPEPVKADSGRVTPDFEHVHRELARPSVTLLLLWNEYVAACRASGGVPYRYSFFNEQYRRWVASTGASMHIRREPGESIEVDWAGDPMGFADPVTGAPVDAWLFVAALSFSAYAYVEAFTDMTLGSWIEAHIHAFETFEGSARLLVPDNLRTGVSRSDRYEPALNPAYARLAEHYDTAIVPARVRKPRDKPVVEGSVRFVANQVAAVLRDRRFVGLAELNEAIFDQVAEINARPFQKREDSRWIVFQRDEKPLLTPLPPMRFELADLRKAKVAPNYHISLDRNYYSVPSKLIGQSLDVRVTSHTIEVFDGAERVACHPRFTGVRARYSTVTSHMPAGHRHRLADWSPQRFEQWAATVGPNCVAAIQAILASRKIVEQSYRSCLGVMSLAKKPGGMVRLEQSCGRALEATPSPSCTLIKKLWATWQPADPPPVASLGDAGFVRGSGYYGQGGGQA
ncbi:MAG TPA: IS21 family transposase [Mycobacterium sp.]|nr:IS21 family transposase [Mycobacterium sp.]